MAVKTLVSLLMFMVLFEVVKGNFFDEVDPNRKGDYAYCWTEDGEAIGNIRPGASEIVYCGNPKPHPGSLDIVAQAYIARTLLMNGITPEVLGWTRYKVNKSKYPASAEEKEKHRRKFL
jgi:hypothetical protein